MEWILLYMVIGLFVGLWGLNMQAKYHPENNYGNKTFYL